MSKSVAHVSSPTSKSSQGLADPVLLEKIDKIFACGVGQYVDLPQLVVVGDQSSGKSSVLAGLSGLPFPRDSTLCTRFATQIIFRRSEQMSVAVSILPKDASDEERSRRLRAWQKNNLGALMAESFASTINEAADVMGVGEKAARSFSRDVLVIEVKGPNEEHLSIVDVPGIFRNVTEGSTTKADINLVRDIVTEAMENPRSMMLAVVAANIDIANQEILSLAKEYDRSGERTLGILTKPDLVEKGAEGSIAELLNGRGNKLTLGWHAVKNPDKSESNADRDRIEEKFFKEVAPWSTISKEKIGVRALQSRIQQLLSTHVRREFPKVRAELSQRLRATRRQLDEMGQDRDTAMLQAQHLSGLASKFQRLTSNALDTKYSGEPIFEQKEDLRLATVMVKRNDNFRDIMVHKGHKVQFLGAEDQFTYAFKRMSVKRNTSRLNRGNPELEDSLQQPVQVDMPKSEGTMDWLRDLYSSSRGFEIGVFQPSILSNAMRKQTEKWETLALGYISDVICIVDHFITEMMEHVCADARVYDGLLATLSDELGSKYAAATNHVKYLLAVEREQIPVTVNRDFREKLEECRNARATASLEDDRFESGQPVEAPNNNLSNTDYTLHEIHDILKSYYDVACNRFVDNVCAQAAGHFLVLGPEDETPLGLFSPKFVLGLSEEQLGEIAGEESHRKTLRQSLRKEIADLEAGRKIIF